MPLNDFIERARAAADLNRPAQVIKLLAPKMSQMGPSEAQQAYPLLLNAYLELGNDDDFRRSSEKALASSPENVHVRILRAAAFGDSHQFPQAMLEIDKALALAPDLAILHIVRSRIAMGLLDLPLALAAAERALELDSSDAWAHSQLARVLSVMDRPEEALAAVNRALALSPDLHEALYLKGDLLGTGSKRMRLIRKALRLNPTNRFYQLSLGAPHQIGRIWILVLFLAAMAVGVARAVLDLDEFGLFCQRFALPMGIVFATITGEYFIFTSSIFALSVFLAFGSPYLFGQQSMQMLLSVATSIVVAALAGLIGGAVARILCQRAKAYPLALVLLLWRNLLSECKAQGLWSGLRDTLFHPHAILSFSLALASTLTATKIVEPTLGLGTQALVVLTQLKLHHFRAVLAHVVRAVALQLQTVIVAFLCVSMGGLGLALPVTILAAIFMSGVDSFSTHLETTAQELGEKDE